MNLRSVASLFLLAALGFGQTFTGTILGTAQDSTGAVLPNVRITVTEQATGVERSSQTNEVGYYEIPLLPPGTYRIDAQFTGFKRITRGNLKLDTSQKMEVPLTLEPGQVNETVEVKGETPLLQTSTSSVSQLIDNKKVVDLPSSNRNLFQIATLTAGVNDFGASAAPATSGSVGFGRWSSNGGQVNTNEFMVDGATALTANMGAASVIPTIDAIEEFKIETNALAAEFGRTGGAVINAIYKSGTNDFHGTVYDFWKNRVLNANSWLNNRGGRPRDFLNVHTFGYSVGGPVLIPKVFNGRNKLFFFHNYEGYRDVLPSRLLLTVPTANERTGDFSQRRTAAGALISIYDPLTTSPVPGQANRYTRTQFPGNVIPASRLDPVARNLVGYYPAPNTTPIDPFSNANNYLVNATGQNRQTMWSIKTDYNLRDGARLFARYTESSQGGGAANLFGPTPACTGCLMSNNPAGAYSARGGGSNLFVYPKNAVVGYSSTLTPTTILDLRYSLNRQLLSRLPQSSGFDLAGAGFPSQFANSVFYRVFPPISIQNYEGLGQRSNGDLLRRGDLSHSLQGSITRITGKHTIKFGGDARMYRYADIQANDVTPSFSFNQAWTQQDPFAPSPTAGWSMASFMLGLPASGNNRIPGSIAVQWFYAAGYFQDDWRVTSRLTLNLGLRYDLETPYTERFDRNTSFDLNARNAATARLATAVGGLQFMGKDIDSRYRNPIDRNNFGPRIGLAYKLRANTVFRAAYGLFYQPVVNTGFGAATFGALGYDGDTPFLTSTDGGLTPAHRLSNPFPDGFNAPTGNADGANTLLGQSVTTQLRNVVTPYTQQFNAGFQHQINSWLIDVGYVGSRGVNQYINIQGNQLQPDLYTRGVALNAQVPNPFLGLVARGTFSNATLSQGQLLRPFPHFADVQYNTVSAGQMNYNALQTKIERRFSNGFSLLTAYTWSKNIGNVGERYWRSTGIQNQYDNQVERSISPIDVAHRMTTAFLYDLPFGKGRRFANALPGAVNLLAGGWQVNGVFTLQSGLPLSLTVPVNSIGFGAGQRPNNNGRSALLAEGERTPLRWFDTSVFSQPAPFTFGNTGPQSPDLRGQGVNSWNVSFFKNTAIRERLNVQFRAEFFNFFNHPLWANPGTTVNTPAFGQVAQKSGNRAGQLALKLIF
ncbi:MAG: TonB-dependent receptor [Bryobacterales bacterium]|nr:TonB-dependent receptor [Bryobacterales bacterium]